MELNAYAAHGAPPRSSPPTDCNIAERNRSPATPVARFTTITPSTTSRTTSLAVRPSRTTPTTASPSAAQRTHRCGPLPGGGDRNPGTTQPFARATALTASTIRANSTADTSDPGPGPAILSCSRFVVPMSPIMTMGSDKNPGGLNDIEKTEETPGCAHHLASQVPRLV
jgi:hypothetical protein